MASLWPWLAVAGVGALHGLNPATGWLLAAALRRALARSRSQALRALVPIGIGHVASIALVAGAVAFGLSMDRAVLRADGRRAARSSRSRFTSWPRAAPRVRAPAGHGRPGALVVPDGQRARRGIDAGAGADPDLHGRCVGPTRSRPRARCCWRSPRSPCMERRCSPSPALWPAACAGASMRCGVRHDSARPGGLRRHLADRQRGRLPVRDDRRLHDGVRRVLHRLVAELPALQRDAALDRGSASRRLSRRARTLPNRDGRGAEHEHGAQPFGPAEALGQRQRRPRRPRSPG